MPATVSRLAPARLWRTRISATSWFWKLMSPERALDS
jgi:hypothetical protein